MNDYYALAAWHYRAGRPAVVSRVLRAVDERGTPLGVLVVSMPVLNATWRAEAWPGWLSGLSKRDAAAQLVAKVRTIARVVVRPCWRGRGVGSLLVRAYLAEPITQRTEALAAMGRLCPLFARCGMRQVTCPPGRAAARLLAALQHARVPPWRLADQSVRNSASRDPQVARALRSLAVDRMRAGKDRPAEELMERLWPIVASRPLVYVHDTPHTGDA